MENILETSCDRKENNNDSNRLSSNARTSSSISSINIIWQ